MLQYTMKIGELGVILRVSAVDIVVQLLNLASMFVDDNADSTALGQLTVTAGAKVEYLHDIS
jgi:hypothetical protein